MMVKLAGCTVLYCLYLNFNMAHGDLVPVVLQRDLRASGAPTASTASLLRGQGVVLILHTCTMRVDGASLPPFYPHDGGILCRPSGTASQPARQPRTTNRSIIPSFHPSVPPPIHSPSPPSLPRLHLSLQRNQKLPGQCIPSPSHPSSIIHPPSPPPPYSSPSYARTYPNQRQKRSSNLSRQRVGLSWVQVGRNVINFIHSFFLSFILSFIHSFFLSFFLEI
ncbi:hypothetical protein IWX49DRAFT_306030 [Phyllosticta citricarpa]|uniref:Uncharacterized protein n=1 Tax=Phyllosticta paracitricarpa TaxID=2016321 RepID=A0ABR1N1S6_9PEZI